jgi:hypothetical protein
MIHIDVKRLRDPNNADVTTGFAVETSTDGAGWKRQFTCALQHGQSVANCKREAEWIATVFGEGCLYAGATIRKTSGGYAL